MWHCTCVKYPADHARQHDDKERKNLQISCQQWATFSMGQGLSSQRSLHNHLQGITDTRLSPRDRQLMSNEDTVYLCTCGSEWKITKPAVKTQVVSRVKISCAQNNDRKCSLKLLRPSVVSASAGGQTITPIVWKRIFFFLTSLKSKTCQILKMGILRWRLSYLTSEELIRTA